MESFNLVVTPEFQNFRLDIYLSQQLSLTRSRVQKLIVDGHVLLNQQATSNNTRLKVNDQLDVIIPDAVSVQLKPVDLSLDVCYEDSDVIVVNKPKGLVVHPGAGHHEVTLVEGLLNHCQDLSGINGELRPGIVHRIDKDTSGLIIVAKNDMAHEALTKQLVNKTMSRKYWAIVHGVIPHEVATIEAPIGRDPTMRQKMAVTHKSSRKAVTHFRVIERFKDFTWVECELQTGRTHQIRVHMQYIGFPIVGDPKYSFRNTLDTQGQMLHAHELTFVHPRSEEKITVNTEIPPLMQELLTELRERGD